MTTLLDRGTSQPAMHALVIGVGGYPHCGPAAPSGSLAAGVGDLSTAQPTAEAMASWLLETQQDDRVLPLGSLEVLITPSDGGPAKVAGDEVERARYDNVAKAVGRWYERCDNPSATSFLYFVGHGCARSRHDQALLLEDFAAWHNPFEGAVDSGRLVEAMGSCAAGTQLFFFDCCRHIPEEVLPTTTLGARSPIALSGAPVGRTALLTLHSTWHGLPAHGYRGEPTPFSRALRDALDGGASWPGADGVWRVEAGDLARSVRRLHERRDPAAAASGEVRTGAESEVPTGVVLRELDTPPLVPFTVDCVPAEATRTAELLLVRAEDGTRLGPRSAPDPWTGEARAGVYELSARFPQGGWHAAALPLLPLMPPAFRRDLHLEQL
ncbi:hypothetical protein [Streptomyces sp. NPDC014746]|uniref:hypothetical protein n=1 Tax=Streptomyces sp. NPDC014746 TaxID=3364904 RepID=UPI003700C295